MGISNQDIRILRYIQEKQNLSLKELSAYFHKDPITLRRDIDILNLYSQTMVVEIKRGIVSTKLSYKGLTDFIKGISLVDYSSSQQERIDVLLVHTFFHEVCNSTQLYQNWNLSLTTKKKDMQVVRNYLLQYNLEIAIVHRKGIKIVGEQIYFHLLVARILHSVFDFYEEDKICERVTNNPMEHECYLLMKNNEHIILNAKVFLQAFLKEYQLKISSMSEKFIVLFIAFMRLYPVKLSVEMMKRFPLTAMNLYITNNENENKIYNYVFNLLDFSTSLAFPYDENLDRLTDTFVKNICNSITATLYERTDFKDACYGYFYRQIVSNYVKISLPDKVIRNAKEHMPILYEIVQKHSFSIAKAYGLHFHDEQFATLAFFIQNAISRNKIINAQVSRDIKRVAVISNATYEHIDYFIHQIKEELNIEFVVMYTLHEREKLERVEYDYVFCLSERVYRILKSEQYPAILLNFFVDKIHIEHLLLYGFTRIETKFLTADFVEEIVGMNKKDMIEFLQRQYKDYFI